MFIAPLAPPVNPTTNPYAVPDNVEMASSVQLNSPPSLNWSTTFIPADTRPPVNIAAPTAAAPAPATPQVNTVATTSPAKATPPITHFAQLGNVKWPVGS